MSLCGKTVLYNTTFDDTRCSKSVSQGIPWFLKVFEFKRCKIKALKVLEMKVILESLWKVLENG